MNEQNSIISKINNTIQNNSNSITSLLNEVFNYLSNEIISINEKILVIERNHQVILKENKEKVYNQKKIRFSGGNENINDYNKIDILKDKEELFDCSNKKEDLNENYILKIKSQVDVMNRKNKISNFETESVVNDDIIKDNKSFIKNEKVNLDQKEYIKDNDNFSNKKENMIINNEKITNTIEDSSKYSKVKKISLIIDQQENINLDNNPRKTTKNGQENEKIMSRLTNLEEILNNQDIVIKNMLLRVEEKQTFNNMISNDNSNNINSNIIDYISIFEKKFEMKEKNLEKEIKENEEWISKLKNDSQILMKLIKNIEKNIKEEKEDKEQKEIKKNKVNDNTSDIKEIFDIENKNKFEFELCDAINRILRIESKIDENTEKRNVSMENDNEKFTSLEIKVKTLIKRQNEYEKEVQNLLLNMNINSIRDSISKLNEGLNLKEDQVKCLEYKDKLSLLESQIEYIKDEIAILTEVSKEMSTIQNLNKKIENLNFDIKNIRSLATNGKDYGKQFLNTINNELAKYLEIKSFESFSEQLRKEYKSLENFIFTVRRQNEEVMSSIQTKVSIDELKKLEDVFYVRIEELKSLFLKRFADKSEMNKNYKYLDKSIKSLSNEVHLRLNKPGDGWILAKKPIDNYQCASCETILGDLKEKKSKEDSKRYQVNKLLPEKDKLDDVSRMSKSVIKKRILNDNLSMSRHLLNEQNEVISNISNYNLILEENNNNETTEIINIYKIRK